MTVTRITKQRVVGRIDTIDKDGTVTDTEEVLVDEIIVDEPMANVGVKVGTTRPIPELGQYNSLRVDVSLYMPSKMDKKSLNKTFKKCFKWCDDKLDEVLDDA